MIAPVLPVRQVHLELKALGAGRNRQVALEEVVGRMFELFRSENSGAPVILIDRRYQLWIDGITWSGHASI